MVGVFPCLRKASNQALKYECNAELNPELNIELNAKTAKH
jgi:hypothetical protein